MWLLRHTKINEVWFNRSIRRKVRKIGKIFEPKRSFEGGSVEWKGFSIPKKKTKKNKKKKTKKSIDKRRKKWYYIVTGYSNL